MYHSLGITFLCKTDTKTYSKPKLYYAFVLYKNKLSRVLVLTPIILATQEAEIRRITVQNQPRQIVHETLSPKHPT
jgi:hypothetical protein